MFKKAAIATLAAAALFGAAALNLDVDIRLKDARAEAAPSSQGEWGPNKPYPIQDVYYPGTEVLGPEEMRVIACGSGMPMPRFKQATACFLIELGNGDKFIFDMGGGSFERLYSLGIPLDYINKVFIGHLHPDHMGDLPLFYQWGPQNNRSVGLRVWGPGGGGTPPEWGMKASMDHMLGMWAWMSSTIVGTIDTKAFALEVNEFDWSKVNNVIYEENGVVIRSIPAIHFEQSASFILEWKGMKLAYSSDTLPNRWWIEHTKGVDFAIHECFLPADLIVEKLKFTPEEALNASTKVHSSAEFFGKVMAMTRPKHAVAYHFQNDADTLPALVRAVEQLYDGPVDYAQDLMVWNVTKDGVRTRMAAVTREAFPTPPLKEKQIDTSADRYQTPERVLAGWPAEEFDPLAEEIYEAFNKRNGTNFKFETAGDE
jgi:ribonuclease Z